MPEASQFSQTRKIHLCHLHTARQHYFTTETRAWQLINRAMTLKELHKNTNFYLLVPHLVLVKNLFYKTLL